MTPHCFKPSVLVFKEPKLVASNKNTYIYEYILAYVAFSIIILNPLNIHIIILPPYIYKEGWPGPHLHRQLLLQFRGGHFGDGGRLLRGDLLLGSLGSDRKIPRGDFAG